MATDDPQADSRQGTAATSSGAAARQTSTSTGGQREKPEQQLEIKAKGMQRTGERERWGKVEAARDRDVLVWIGRFRFVTTDVLARRFGVSAQRMRARVRRLEQRGHVQRVARLPNQAAVIYLTPRGSAEIGSRRHRPPRPDTHRAHELALTELVCQLEQAARPGLEVLTERDARDREATSQRRYSVDVTDEQGRRAKRWADVLITSPTRTVAMELEFAEKSSARLRGILDSYLASSMSEVRFLVSSPTLAGRLSLLAAQQAHGMRAFSATLCAITIAPWSGVTPDVADAIRARLT